MLPPSRADFPADDDGGGAAHSEDGHGTQILNVASQGPGGQNFRGMFHVAHDHLVHGGAQPPQSFVKDHRAGVAEELGQQGAARPEQNGGLQAEPAVGAGIGHGDNEFQHTGEQGGDGGPLHPQRGSPQIAENKHPVEEGVGAHGDGKDDHAQLGVFHGPVSPHIDSGDAVKKVGGPYDTGIAGSQGDQVGVVGEQSHKLGGEEAHDRREEGGNGPCHITAQTDDPVDGIGIPLAPELADQHRRAALQPKDHQLDNEHRQVGLGHSGQRGFPQTAHHKGIHQAQQGGTQILQQDRQGQQDHVSIKGPAPVQIGKQSLTSLQCGFG